MPRPLLAEVLVDAVTSFPDNINGAITPLILRTWIGKLVEAIRPTYGYVFRVTGAQAVGTSDIPIVCDNGFSSEVTHYTFTPSTGTIHSLENGVNELCFKCSIDGSNGTGVTVTLYKNGVATPWRVSTTLAGSGNFQSIYMNAIEYSGFPANYQVQIKIDAGSQTLSINDVLFLAKSQAS